MTTAQIAGTIRQLQELERITQERDALRQQVKTLSSQLARIRAILAVEVAAAAPAHPAPACAAPRTKAAPKKMRRIKPQSHTGKILILLDEHYAPGDLITLEEVHKLAGGQYAKIQRHLHNLRAARWLNAVRGGWVRTTEMYETSTELDTVRWHVTHTKGPWTPSEIARDLGMTSTTPRQTLHALAKEGVIHRVCRGVYAKGPAPGTKPKPAKAKTSPKPAPTKKALATPKPTPSPKHKPAPTPSHRIPELAERIQGHVLTLPRGTTRHDLHQAMLAPSCDVDTALETLTSAGLLTINDDGRITLKVKVKRVDPAEATARTLHKLSHHRTSQGTDLITSAKGSTDTIGHLVPVTRHGMDGWDYHLHSDDAPSGGWWAGADIASRAARKALKEARA